MIESRALKVRPRSIITIAILAMIFGLATVISGGKSLFTEAGRVAAGNYVPFVLRFNFVAGFAYIVAGFGLVTDQAWSGRLAIVLAAGTSFIFLIFGIHILIGGAYENSTVLAMLLRSGFWLITARISYLRFKK